MPWVNKLNSYKKVEFINCLYLYHGSAILRRYSTFFIRFRKKYLTYKNSIEATGPRDYSNSSIILYAEHNRYQLLNYYENQKVGYSVGKYFFLLDEELSSIFLLKKSCVNLHVTQNMHDWKRVGLYIFLEIM